jgi:hypothetical protein
MGGDFIHHSFWCVKSYFLKKILFPFLPSVIGWGATFQMEFHYNPILDTRSCRWLVLKQLMLMPGTSLSNVCFYLLFWIWILEISAISLFWISDKGTEIIRQVMWNETNSTPTRVLLYCLYQKGCHNFTMGWPQISDTWLPLSSNPPPMCSPVIYTQVSVYFSWFTKVCNPMQTGLPAKQTEMLCEWCFK